MLGLHKDWFFGLEIACEFMFFDDSIKMLPVSIFCILHNKGISNLLKTAVWQGFLPVCTCPVAFAPAMVNFDRRNFHVT